MSIQRTLDEKNRQHHKPPSKLSVEPQNDAPLTSANLNAPLTPQKVTQLQQTVGNGAVQRWLVQRQGNTGATEVEEETAGVINQERGHGNTLDAGIAAQVGGTLGNDLSQVHVHTDPTAHQLNHQLGAKAFTIGNDIFFREGAYNPSSSEGQHLLAHELTHVVQQGGSQASVQGKMMVNDPNDQYESQADSVANQVMTQPEEVQRQEVPEEEEEAVQRQEMPEEEEAVI